MATLHVRSIPDDLYERLRQRARQHGRSINAEAIELLRPALAERTRLGIDELLDDAARMRVRHSRGLNAPTVAEMIREDRER